MHTPLQRPCVHHVITEWDYTRPSCTIYCLFAKHGPGASSHQSTFDQDLSRPEDLPRSRESGARVDERTFIGPETV